MVWSDLRQEDKDMIVDAVNSGTRSIKGLAIEFDLLPQSLSRSIRKVRQAAVEPAAFASQENKREVFNNEVQSSVDLIIDSPKKFLVFGDAHFPYVDPKAAALVLMAAEMIRPDYVINLGDTLDHYSFSTYSKNPRRVVNDGFQRELDSWFDWASALKKVTPGAERYILWGNHEERFKKWIRESMQVFALDALNLNALMRLDELGFNHLCSEIRVNPKGEGSADASMLYFSHGKFVKKHSGQSALAESLNLGFSSTISGHVHRAGSITIGTPRGLVRGYEVGCLAELSPDWVSRPNWSQSFLTGVVDKNDFFFNNNVINNGVTYVNGVRLEVV